ncbi:MAG: molybdopterin-dependent oxidoreductase [Rhodoferax sp.]|nr:molybdopterin-dependent oxidoreductase [Rhodoferax sp.]
MSGPDLPAAVRANGASRTTRSTCPYCGVGCGVLIDSVGEQITGVRGDPDHPANRGRLCTKGSTLHLSASSPVAVHSRLLQPQVRDVRGGPTRVIGWDAALDDAARRLAAIITLHGPDAVGFYISGQLLTEDYYVFNKLAKGLVGTNAIDSNSRLCMSSAVAGYKQTLGMDSVPACYDDLNHAACVFITGANPAYAHPILFRRLEDARRANPAQKWIVVDPRRTDTAAQADLHLQIQPGTDVWLHHGLLHIMLWEGWVDAAFIAVHTSGFDALKAMVRDCTPARVAQVCGIAQADLVQAARWFAGVGDSMASHTADGAASGTVNPTRMPTLSLYCQGLNQSSHGTDNNTSLINLHLACGQIGKPGAGPLSLTGQPNAMGGREVGGMANLLSAHRDLANTKHRAEVAALWGVPSVPATPGPTALEMFQAAADGRIKALWIVCTNPAHSLPDQALVRRALQRAELVVVQDSFATPATCDFADLLLPAATWGEKDGTVTNSERCISRQRTAVPAPGAARPDWAIATALAQALRRHLPSVPDALRFDYTTPESVWNEHRESTRGRDLDITGLSYAQLEQGPQLWPFAQGASHATERLYTNSHFATPDGRARFVACAPRPVATPCSARFPFALTTGRLRDQWHGMSRTGNVARLFGHASEPVVQLNPADMQQRGIKDGELVHLTSAQGSVLLPAQASAEVAPLQAFVAMHWGPEWVSGARMASAAGPAQVPGVSVQLAGVNALTAPALCPHSRQPEFKHTPIKVLKAELPWQLVALAWLPAQDLPAARQALQSLFGAFDFASLVLFGNGAADAQTERVGLHLRAACAHPPAPLVVQRVQELLGVTGIEVIRYADAKRSQWRAARLIETDTHTQLEAYVLAGDARAHAWMATLLKEGQPAPAYGRAILIPGATPPIAVVSRGRPVCTCMDVTDVAITDHLAQCIGAQPEPGACTPANALASLQATLHCGTQCGSCVPQLQRLVRAALPTTATVA